MFESSSEDLIGTINDIFITLDDLDVEYKISNLKNIGLIHIKVDIYSDNSLNEDIDNSIQHLINYLRSENYDFLEFKTGIFKMITHIFIELDRFKEIESSFIKNFGRIGDLPQDSKRNGYIILSNNEKDPLFAFKVKYGSSYDLCCDIKVYEFIYNLVDSKSPSGLISTEWPDIDLFIKYLFCKDMDTDLIKSTLTVNDLKSRFSI